MREKTIFDQKQTEVIDDPVRHAGSVAQKPFHVTQRIIPWESFASVHTTSDYDSLGKGYKRHCGPVAVTNLILTLDKWRQNSMNEESMIKNSFTDDFKAEEIQAKDFRATDFKAEDFTAGNINIEENDNKVEKRKLQHEEVFQTVSCIGEKMLIYHNMDLLHRFGGTSDLLTSAYLAVVLRHYQIPCSIVPLFPGRKGRLLELARQKKLLYLQLRHHPCYGSHHVICYGAVEVESNDRQDHALYLAIADGWVHQIRYLSAAGLGLYFGLQIEPQMSYSDHALPEPRP